MENNLANTVSNALVNKKAHDVMYIDIQEMTTIADGFILASGRSVTQVKALCDEIADMCKKDDIPRGNIEGYDSGRWIIVDLIDIMVHIFHYEDREFYNIERLWINENNMTRFE